MRCLATLATAGLLVLTMSHQGHAQDAREVIRAELTAIEQAWNRADLDRHVAAYADSATMMGSRGLIRGRAAIRETLARGFWRDGKPLQQLRFDEVEIRLIGDGTAAIVTGRFTLTGGGRDDASGRFSTIWERRDGTWLTVHDHSS